MVLEVFVRQKFDGYIGIPVRDESEAVLRAFIRRFIVIVTCVIEPTAIRFPEDAIFSFGSILVCLANPDDSI
ncbi:hypothetical protein [Pseudaminobacter soli (ex Li et al. 2025)]|uniref:Uncharacterized protein n=1 Tax=Pseudaminobacter soli (ex Li et al. 2025) TaxID=1295366 RepID=A0A2P7S218_9HYPH|nr:hypothetical protein [Mesorhizobium soli]PSJ56483.1 hypothetical protein C7I85_24720 [Mesorhizobium soli]